MKTLLPLALILLTSASAFAGDSTNSITPKLIKKAVLEKQLPLALEIHRNGGLSGFHAAPGQSMDGTENILDWLVQKIAIDENGNPTDETPLTATRTRNLRIGDKLPYVLSNYPMLGTSRERPTEFQRRYNYLLATVTDSNGKQIPVVTSFRDLTPEFGSAEFSTLGKRDIVSLIGVFPDYANYLGAYIQYSKRTHYNHSFGANYADKNTTGIERFAHPLFPNPVPPPGTLWHASILQKVFGPGSIEEILKLPVHDANSLAVQMTYGKRLMFSYGIRGKQTKPLDTIVAILSHNNPNTHGTAPMTGNPSRQHERIFLTKEFGYSIRWELWNCESPREDIVAAAKKFYATNALGMPADMSGKYNEHLEIGPIIEDKELGLYKHTMTLTNPKTGRKETRTWYLTGGHDYTNLQRQTADTPFVTTKDIPPEFLSQFGIKKD